MTQTDPDRYNRAVRVLAKQMAGANKDAAIHAAQLRLDATVLFLGGTIGPIAVAERLYRLADAYAVVPENWDAERQP